MVTKDNSKEFNIRERKILYLIANGSSNKKIASKLLISHNTVKVLVKKIVSKLGAVNRTNAVYLAFKKDLISENDDKDIKD